MSPTNKKRKPWKRADWMAFASIVITLLFGILVFAQNDIQNDKINSLSRSELANEVLVSSLQKDQVIKLDELENFTIEVTSNFEGATPIYVKDLVVRLDGEQTPSGYKLDKISPEEQIAKNGKDVYFSYEFKPSKVGVYEIDFLVYYNYNQEIGFNENSPNKDWTFSLEVIR